MTDEGKAESAAEDLARARRELRAAELLLQNGEPRIAASRIYYAAFHAARALLFAEGHEPTTHAGVQSLLALHYVKTGRLPPETIRLIARLERYRDEADYAEVYVEDERATRADLVEARGFVDRAAALLGA